MAIKFGTDGWRAIIGEEYTFENVRFCSQGTALLLKQQGLDKKKFLIGYDSRFSSEKFARSVAEVMSGNGIKILLSDRIVPTPVISYNIVNRNAGGGVVITASHNAADWNGYKYKPHYGGSATPEVVSLLESHIREVELTRKVDRMDFEDAKSKGLLEEFNPEIAYMSHIRNIIDIEMIRKSGLKVIVDSMHGAGSGYLNKLLSGVTAEILEIRSDRNPAFPGMLQPEPLDHNLANLKQAVKSQNADVGLATDGDADRLGVVDENGEFVTTLDVFALLCLHHLEVLGLRGPLVRSITMTSMVDKLGELYDVPVFDTPVGFKYLGPVMVDQDALLAGEESGGYAFQGNIPERDGILSGLMLLDMMVRTGKTVSELLIDLRQRVGPHYYCRSDIKFDPGKRVVIDDRLSTVRPSHLGGKLVSNVDDRDGLRYELQGGYWVMVRFSGTEPILRIYAEADSLKSSKQLLAEVAILLGL